MKTKTIISSLMATFMLSLNGASGGLRIMYPQQTNETQTTMNKDSHIKAFLENPTAYQFLCTSTSEGEVLNAKLSAKGELTIAYKSIWDDGDHSGVAFGTYTAHNHKFSGRYTTNDGRFEGEINFSFTETGEAKGSWDHGYGTVRLPLKK